MNARDNSGNTPLHWAAYGSENPAIITALLDAGADVNVRAGNGLTPLHFAAASNPNPANIGVLLDAGADATARDNRGYTPLDYAGDREELQGSNAYQRLAAQAAAVDCEGWNTAEFFERATVAEVQACLAAGMGVNARDDEYGGTPLHNAAWFNDNPAVIRALLEAGADVNAREVNDWTPLHSAAAFNGNPAIVRALLTAGAEANASTDNGRTPLHFAAGDSSPDPDVITALIEAGAEVNARDNEGNTPLHEAGTFPLLSDPITVLLDAGAEVNAQNERGETPLHLIVKNAILSDPIAVLLEAGADVGARDADGKIPGDYARELLRNTAPAVWRRLNEGRLETTATAGCAGWNTVEFFVLATPSEVEGCLDVGARVDARDEDGLTPLHFAASLSDNPAVTWALVDAGALA